jgi:hypothetical protein
MERLLRLKQQNPDYQGFRGANTVTVKPPPPLESAVCSVCQRKRNVPRDVLPEDRSSFVCMTCQQAEST